jgi:hypothetical protein
VREATSRVGGDVGLVVVALALIVGHDDVDGLGR